jgi:hypothetical protein
MPDGLFFVSIPVSHIIEVKTENIFRCLRMIFFLICRVNADKKAKS